MNLDIDVGRVKVLVAERETTLSAVAKQCGIASSTVTGLLQKGRTRCGTAGRLAHALGVSVADIMADAGTS